MRWSDIPPEAAAVALRFGQPAGCVPEGQWLRMSDEDRALSVLRNTGGSLHDAAAAVTQLADIAGGNAETNAAVLFLARSLRDLAVRADMATAVLLAAEDAAAAEAERAERRRRRTTGKPPMQVVGGVAAA